MRANGGPGVGDGAGEPGATREDLPGDVLDRLAGAAVVGSDGRTVGRVRDIYRGDADGELRAVTVTAGRFSSRTVLVPIDLVDTESLRPALRGDADSRDRSDPVRLRVEAAVARAGLPPEPTAHASPELLERAAAALSGTGR